LDDPYLVGRIAALNSASDVFALAGKPLAALALATVPLGSSDQQQRMLYEVLAGALEEFRRMSATLVGGHTIEGPQLTVGFTVLAEQGNSRPRVKGGLRAGDRLILTKPLGTGILLAAHMQARCRAPWMERLLPAMLLSNQAAASLVDEFDIEGLTDITGFGLAGHLLEMLQAANVSAELTLQQIPLLPGVAELHAQGVESTLAPANRTAEAQILISEPQRESPLYAVLFDPQTCGGLLMGVPEQHADAVLARLAQQSDIPSAIIGRILPPDPEKPRIMVI
jgi:selenide,water dikinase